MKIIIFITLAFSLSTLASNKKIKIGVANFPPYSIVENGKISGVEADIIKAAMERVGYKVTLESYPYGRLPISFSGHLIDATIVTQKNFKGLNVYYSDIVLPEYQTVAVHLKAKQMKINGIKDLHEKSIIAHQRAHLYYGPEYKKVSESKKTKYMETARQTIQVPMLYTDKADVIVLAHEIFNYYLMRSEYKDLADQVIVSKIFGPKFGFHNVFWEKEARDDFNRGLKLIKKDGTYQNIVKKYLKFSNYN